MQVLNPGLYRALQKAFNGHVRVENHSERRRVVHHPDWQRGGRLTASSITSGEYYCVNCWNCHDTRQRLYVNHQWGERDAVSGDENLHLVHCFNEACLGSRTRQKQLFNRVYPLGKSRQASPADGVNIELVEASPSGTATLPHPSWPINQTFLTSQAANYLQERGFDVDFLWNEYNVSYCFHTDTYVKHRIVIPIYTLEPTLNWAAPSIRLAGWQARCVGDPQAGEPKYLSAKGMKKSQLLYGLPQAVRTTGPVVLVEGPTDAWRLGGNAVALLGKDMSRGQLEIIARYFRGRPLVIFLDGDARDAANRVRRELREAQLAADRPVVIADPPAGRNDVGECTSAEAWDCVDGALHRAAAYGPRSQPTLP